MISVPLMKVSVTILHKSISGLSGRVFDAFCILPTIKTSIDENSCLCHYFFLLFTLGYNKALGFGFSQIDGGVLPRA